MISTFDKDGTLAFNFDNVTKACNFYAPRLTGIIDEELNIIEFYKNGKKDNRCTLYLSTPENVENYILTAYDHNTNVLDRQLLTLIRTTGSMDKLKEIVESKAIELLPFYTLITLRDATTDEVKYSWAYTTAINSN